MSPGCSRLVRFLVRASTRATPWTPGPRSGSRRGRTEGHAHHRPSCHARAARSRHATRPAGRRRSAAAPLGVGDAPAAPRRAPGPSSESSMPASIRASSRTRPSPSSTCTPLRGDLRRHRPSRPRRCRSANAATCGRWVTTSTWACRPAGPAGAPTSSAARPPTPASTSSKTKVGTGSPPPASTTSRASITRDSSPPEAALADAAGPGRRGGGAAGARPRRRRAGPNRTGVASPGSRSPSGSARRPSATCTTAVRHGQLGQLGGDRARRGAGGGRAARALSVAAASASSARSVAARAELARSGRRRRRARPAAAAASLGPGEHAVDVVAVLARSAPRQRGPPLLRPRPAAPGRPRRRPGRTRRSAADVGGQVAAARPAGGQLGQAGSCPVTRVERARARRPAPSTSGAAGAGGVVVTGEQPRGPCAAPARRLLGVGQPLGLGAQRRRPRPAAGRPPRSRSARAAAASASRARSRAARAQLGELGLGRRASSS